MKRSALAAWTLLALMVCAFVALLFFSGGRTVTSWDIPFVLIFIFWGVLGLLIAIKRPGHPIGWTLQVIGLVTTVTAWAEVYGTGEGVPADGRRSFAAWFETWAGDWVPPLLVMVVLLLFPRGRLQSRLDRIAFVVASVACVLGGFAVAATPGRLPGHSFANPYGVDALRPVLDVLDAVLVDGPGLALAFVLCLVALVARLRRSGGEERQQLKWFVFAASLAVTTIFLGGLLSTLGVLDGPNGNTIGGMLFMVSMVSLPLTIAIAILKYRLYDIDVVINRALVYAALTAILAAAYVALVFGFQALLSPFTAESDLAIAGSTLAVAAFFRPVRARSQRVIDHRFYRRKFDAQRTLEEFNAQLRDEVDLQALSTSLEVGVQDTMQPAHISLWLRGT